MLWHQFHMYVCLFVCLFFRERERERERVVGVLLLVWRVWVLVYLCLLSLYLSGRLPCFLFGKMKLVFIGWKFQYPTTLAQLSYQLRKSNFWALLIFIFHAFPIMEFSIEYFYCICTMYVLEDIWAGNLKEYSVILKHLFYGMNQKITSKQADFENFSLFQYYIYKLCMICVHWHCSIDYSVKLSLVDETLCKHLLSFH